MVERYVKGLKLDLEGTLVTNLPSSSEKKDVSEVSGTFGTAQAAEDILYIAARMAWEAARNAS